MSRPTKPQFIAPRTVGAGFGDTASQMIQDLPAAMDFIDESNDYQDALITAPTDIGVVAGDKAAQGISASTARRLLFVNADGTGLTTDADSLTPDSQLETDAFFAQTKVVGNGITNNRGQIQGYRFLEMSSPNGQVLANRGFGSLERRQDRFLRDTPFGEGRSDPEALGLAHQYRVSNGLHMGVTSFSVVVRAVSSDFNVRINASSVNTDNPPFFTSSPTNGRSLQVRSDGLDETRFDLLGPTTGFGDNIQEPEARMVTSPGFTSGLYFINVRTCDTKEEFSFLQISVGRYGPDDYVNAFRNGNGYDCLTPGHPNFLFQERFDSTNTVTETTQLVPTLQWVSGIVRIFDMQTQINGSRALIDTLRN